MLHPAIFLDRDGVIIENRANYVRSWADVEIFPQAVEALIQVRHLPYKIIIVTNQSVVGHGLISYPEAKAINNRLVADIETKNGRIDAVYMCPHIPSDHCVCRKPKPGMLRQAAQEHAIDLKNSFMIGDALSDVAAGQAAGVKLSILVRTGRGAIQGNLPETANFTPFPIYDDLQSALVKLFQ
jgi:D-glycero-D-manno-heptose 1,7-bisphosphate phosphatase